MIRGGWSELHHDILDMIIHRLNDLIVDLVNFGAVCRSWRSSSSAHRLNCHEFLKSTTQIPWIMLQHSPLNLYNISSHKSYFFHLPGLPNSDKKIIGCSNGYIIYKERDISLKMLYIANPLTGIHFTFPTTPYESFSDASKVLVVKNDNNLMVVIMPRLGRDIAIAKPGDNSWTYLHSPKFIYDIIFHKGDLYAVMSDGTMLIFYNICDGNNFDKFPVIHDPPEKLEEENKNGFHGVGRTVIESHDGNDLFMFVNALFNCKRIDKLYKRDSIRCQWDVVSYSTFDDLGFSLFKGDQSLFFLKKSQCDYVVAACCDLSRDRRIYVCEKGVIFTPKKVYWSLYSWFMPSLA